MAEESVHQNGYLQIDPPDKKARKVQDPMKLVGQLIYVALLYVPMIIWSIVEYFFLTESKSIKNEVVLITGAGRGLGRGLAVEFAKNGCKVACVDVDTIGNDETVSIINEQFPECAKGYKANVAKVEEIKEIAKEIENDFDHVDILVNNAGLVSGGFSLLEMEDYQYEAVIQVNLLSHFKMIRQFLPSMLKRNHGHIVAISSVAGLSAMPKASAYVSSKWGINGLMECVTEELRENPKNEIKTTVICPYFINTSAFYTNIWQLRIPELSIEEVANKTVTAVKRNETIITIPKQLYWFSIIQKLLPNKLKYMFRDIFRVTFNTLDKEVIEKTRTLKIMLETVPQRS